MGSPDPNPGSRVARGTATAIALVGAAIVGALAGPRLSADTLPPGFVADPVGFGFYRPTKVAFLPPPGDRILVAEQGGMIWLVDGASVTIFLNLTEEVHGVRDRGLLGMALDPNFESNGYLYLLYNVDWDSDNPTAPPAEPDEPPEAVLYGRLTRYTVDPVTATVDLGSRFVIVGVDLPDSFPECHQSHTIGTVLFGEDGTLLAGSGDGAHYDFVDYGQDIVPEDALCATIFGADQDLGAYRAQYLNSLNGKIVRLDPATGLGLPSNPFWDGDPTSRRSKIWTTGSRNPYRFSLRPGTGSRDPADGRPGTLYVGDIGWFLQEEISVARRAGGGENFGWPCFEGPDPQADYRGAPPPPAADCSTLETPSNPGPVTPPLLWWHHVDPLLSFPQGPIGNSAIAGPFYTGRSYPCAWRDVFFAADFQFGLTGWIRSVVVDENDAYVTSADFLTGANQIVDVSLHPRTGELFVTDHALHQVRRIRWTGPDADADGDTLLDPADCACSDAGAVAPPAVVDGLRATKPLFGPAFLEWTDQSGAAGSGTVYDIASGRLSALHADGGFLSAFCLDRDARQSPYPVAAPPPSGDGFWYLVRARNSCLTNGATYGDSTVNPDPRDLLDDPFRFDCR